MYNIIKKLTPLINKLSSQPVIGGIEVSGTHLRYLRIEGQKSVTASLRLPPGIILRGKVADKKNFIAALKKISAEVCRGRKEILHAVVSLPPSSVFTQSFSLPKIAAEKLEEAALLNLQMISPLESAVSYSDWQVLGSTEDKVDILGAFAEKNIVDDINDSLRSAGFLPVAFEFPALSLARVARNLSPLANFPASFVTVSLSGDGIDTSILRNGALYFSYFRSWESVRGPSRDISMGELKDIISLEVSRVMNFLSSRFSESPLGVVIISPGMEGDLAKFVTEELKLKVFPFSLKRYSGLAPIWHAALGAALRGLIPRDKDVLISLYGLSAKEEFYKLRTLSFVSLWRNILAACAMFFVLVFGGALILLNRLERDVEEQMRLITVEPDVKAAAELQAEARAFNQKVSLISAAHSQIQDLSPLLDLLENIARQRATLESVYIPSPRDTIQVRGKAASEKLALSFKDALAADPRFSQVTLPLSSIASSESGVSFNLSFTFSQ